ncbi:hypothetical protein N865_01275 [Intrasporangium oryzae NRRL B-24470]|uniref:Glycosyl transferase family 4 n=1 Tax=Intrasporangium oryzae NRRL B-24470 TaxID=1386089 RepID=W9G151_9MICO|nr:hypothetical protein [Intrasporangium oryzae]EWS99664.1 hypothetical protein N865_01275 [Intrasporangium oryzae NRRL B-24470]
MSRARVRGTLLPALTSAAVSALALHAMRRLPAAVRQPWERANHAGAPVTLLEGPAWVLGAAAGSLVTGGPSSVTATARLAPAVVAVASGALGALDDLRGGASSKGLKGHLSALRRGEVTTGAIKIVGLGVTGLVGAALLDRGRRGPFSTLVGGAVVAGAANAVNLFDLRPGRALKVTACSAAPLLGGPGAAAPAALGASLGVIGDDLAARSMLGDTGANAAGALVGLAFVERTGLLGRAVALAGLTALTLASERVSFTAVIEGNPVLRRIDEWGRAPR